MVKKKRIHIQTEQFCNIARGCYVIRLQRITNKLYKEEDRQRVYVCVCYSRRMQSWFALARVSRLQPILVYTLVSEILCIKVLPGTDTHTRLCTLTHPSRHNKLCILLTTVLPLPPRPIHYFISLSSRPFTKDVLLRCSFFGWHENPTPALPSALQRNCSALYPSTTSCHVTKAPQGETSRKHSVDGQTRRVDVRTENFSLSLWLTHPLTIRHDSGVKRGESRSTNGKKERGRVWEADTNGYRQQSIAAVDAKAFGTGRDCYEKLLSSSGCF